MVVSRASLRSDSEIGNATRPARARHASRASSQLRNAPIERGRGTKGG